MAIKRDKVYKILKIDYCIPLFSIISNNTKIKVTPNPICICLFKSQAIQDYFNAKTWYTQIGTYNPNMDAIYNQMTDIEKSNIDFLQNSDNGGE